MISRLNIELKKCQEEFDTLPVIEQFLDSFLVRIFDFKFHCFSVISCP